MLSINDDQVEVHDIMRAFDAEVVDAVWEAVEALLPALVPDDHPLVVTGAGSRIECVSRAS